MNIHSISICFVIFPFSFEDITINMPKLSFSTCFIFFPFTIITSTIRPLLKSSSFSHISSPFSIKYGSTLKSKWRSFFNFVRVANLLVHCFLGLIVREILIDLTILRIELLRTLLLELLLLMLFLKHKSNICLVKCIRQNPFTNKWIFTNSTFKVNWIIEI